MVRATRHFVYGLSIVQFITYFRAYLMIVVLNVRDSMSGLLHTLDHIL